MTKLENCFLRLFFGGQFCPSCGEQMERESKNNYVCKNIVVHRRLNPQ